MPIAEEHIALLGELARALRQATLPADAVEERLAAVASSLGIAGEFITMQLAPGFLGTRVIASDVQVVRVRSSWPCPR